MKRSLTHSSLALTLALFGSPLDPAQKKYSPDHYSAIKKCNDDYIAAIEASGALSEKARKDAVTLAVKNKQQCLANAPK
jgi:hypothetical protein